MAYLHVDMVNEQGHVVAIMVTVVAQWIVLVVVLKKEVVSWDVSVVLEVTVVVLHQIGVVMARVIAIVTATVDTTLLLGEEEVAETAIVGAMDYLAGILRQVGIMLMTVALEKCTILLSFCMPEWDYWLVETHADF